MGISSDAIIAYGIDLGEEWQDLVPWNEEDGFDDWYRARAGLPEWEDGMSPEESSAFFAERRAVSETSPVADIYHCSYDYSMLILAVPGTELRAYRGDPKELPGLLDLDNEKVEAFRAALNEWGVLPLKGEEPRWLLFSMFG